MSEAAPPTSEPGYLAQAWLVILLSTAFAAGLTAVQLTLSERIAANKQAETMEAIPRLVPGAETAEPITSNGRQVFRALAEGRPIGWVVPASGQGFADRIELLVGLDATAQTITGIYVLDQKETPSLGNKIVEPAWQAQFAGRPTDAELQLRNEGGTIDAISGATISSASVCAIVSRTLRDVVPGLQAQGGADER